MKLSAEFAPLLTVQKEKYPKYIKVVAGDSSCVYDKELVDWHFDKDSLTVEVKDEKGCRHAVVYPIGSVTYYVIGEYLEEEG